jgi:predicted O-methyltransferase YrrM
MRTANTIDLLRSVSPGVEQRADDAGIGYTVPRNGITARSSLLRRALFAVRTGITNPRSAVSWIVRGHLAKDQVFVSQTYWFAGDLPRLRLAEIFPGIENMELVLPRAFDRNAAPRIGASITVNEACHLAAIARWLDAARALEIGTYDGNTALLLAANVAGDGRVVTVDLPPDFTKDQQRALTSSDGEFNLTDRRELGRQTKNHPLGARIEQVYGDSAELDWASLGGPFDLIFIDGCHAEAYVDSDTRNAMQHLKPRGVIVWHDYGMIPEVSQVIDRFARDVDSMQTTAIEGTRLAIARSRGRR